jgi:hypothetical protein
MTGVHEGSWVQRATGSGSHARGMGQHRPPQTPAVAGTYWTIELPRHWVVEVEDALWAVPAVCGGWTAREPYDGPREQLRPYTRRTATIIQRLLCSHG